MSKEKANLDMFPADHLAERAVLAKLMLGSSFDDVLEILPLKDCFDATMNQAIYSVMIELHKKQIEINIVSVYRYIEEKNLTEVVGGISYLMDVSEEISPTATATSLAKIIYKLYISRSVIKENLKINKMLMENPSDGEKILADYVTRISDFLNTDSKTDLVHIREPIANVFENYSKIKEGEIDVMKKYFVPTGFKPFDDFTYGLEKTSLIIVAARPGMGKTSFSTDVGINIAELLKLPVALFSLEMSKEKITQRVLSNRSGVSNHLLLTNKTNADQWNSFSETAARLMEIPFYIDDGDAADMRKFRNKAKALKAKHGELGAIIFDYIQLADMEDENQTVSISKITREMKKIAMELKAPVIALSQLSRAVEKRPNKRPQLSDLRQSGGIEENADMVMFIYRDDYYNEYSTSQGIAELIFAKCRSSQVGTVKMGFDAGLTRFFEIEED